MKALSLMLVVATYTSSAYAANPGTICVTSTKTHLIIEPAKKIVRVFQWDKVVDTFAILKSQVRSIETLPAIWQTTYTLEDGYKIVVEYASGEDRGRGYATKDDNKAAEYRFCYEADDINR